MSTHRSLLRLEDKLAGEGRRLQRIGGPPLGQLLPVMVVAALVLHGGLLLLPLVRMRVSLPESSPPQDFPLVWRTASPPAPVVPAHEVFRPDSVRSPNRLSSAPALPARTPSVEPVPEPSPELGVSAMMGEADTVIPPPDIPPPAVVPGPSATPPPSTRAAPVLVYSVRPAYPAAARSLGAEARVTVRLTVGPDGRVEDTSVLGCSRPNLGFEAAALDSVRRWRYQPQPVPAGERTVIVTVEFKRERSRP
jgi:TonB family protein